MKYLTTKKEMKAKYYVYDIGNGKLQNMLRYIEPFAYSTRGELGWACDYYDIGKGIVLCDGYASTGHKVAYSVMELFDNKAEQIWHEFRYDEKKVKQMLSNLIADFIGTIQGR